MYRYISAAVSLENLRQQVAKPIFEGNAGDYDYDSPEDLFKLLVDVDPTADYDSNKGGKYAPWIIRQYLKGNLTERDFTNLRDALKHFAIQSKKYAHSDLGQYKTVEEFLTDAERVGNMPLTEKERAKQLKKNAHRANTADKEFVTSDGPWELWIPKTHAGSISLAREGGTKARWCTAYEGNDHYWQQYTQGYNAGTLYIFLNTNDPNEKYQLHFETDSWFDINDYGLGMDKFYEFISDKPNFSAYFKVFTENGITRRANTIIAIEDGIKDLVIEDDITGVGCRHYPSSLESITYPDSWTTLYGPKLRDLSNLQSIHLPKALTTISANFISRLVDLRKVDMPDALETIEPDNFSDCENLSTIDLPDTVKAIGLGCFRNTGLYQFRFPDAMTVIPPRFFANWEELNSVDLNNIQVIRTHAFLDTIVGPVNGLNNVKKFFAESFKGSSVSDLELNPEATIGSYAFSNCIQLTSVTLTESMTLGIGCFDGCTGLTVYWSRPDEDYEFENIHALICSRDCTKLIEANKGYVVIDTIEGDHYDAEI